jgi:hypothetical protein
MAHRVTSLARDRVWAVYRIDELISPVCWLRPLMTVAALAAALLVWSEDAEARLEGQLSLTAAAAQNLLVPAGRGSAPAVVAAADHASSGQQSGSLGGLFNRPGLLGGFAAGFLGAGPLGLVFGQGLAGGLGGVASYLGLMAQLALVVMLCRVIWVWWTGRNQPAFVGLSTRQLADPYLRSRRESSPDVGVPLSPEAETAQDDAEPGSLHGNRP